MRNYLNNGRTQRFAPTILIGCLIFSFFILLTLTGIIHQKTQYKTQIAGIKTSTAETTVSLSIGEFRFTLFGYTSPQTQVIFSGLGIYDETYADETGYFIFNNRFSPFSPREACLTAQDVLGRLSTPLCLPPFPTIYNVEIGPVIMPPTISADVGEYFVGDEALLSGQTIPNTEVDLAFFTGSGRTNVLLTRRIGGEESLANARKSETSDKGGKFSLIPFAYAFSFPQLQTKSDEKGNFSISIPTNDVTTLRAFARTTYEEFLSPKSLTLNIKVFPWWMIILKMFGLVFDLLKKHWLEISLLVEFIILSMILIEHFFHPHRIAETRAIVLREKRELLSLY